MILSLKVSVIKPALLVIERLSGCFRERGIFDHVLLVALGLLFLPDDAVLHEHIVVREVQCIPNRVPRTFQLDNILNHHPLLP